MNIKIDLANWPRYKAGIRPPMDEWLSFQINGMAVDARLHETESGISLDIYEKRWDGDTSDKCLLSLSSEGTPWQLLGMLLDHAEAQKDG